MFYLFVIQNKLLKLPPRKLLKADAVSTIFSYITKVTNKRHASEKREDLSRKK